jgi:eukaryotic-like serine/threonine-protein kinase
MGEVWKARDTRLGREVAVKILSAEVSSNASRLKRFETEARAASALNHPNIITIYDIGTTDAVSWIAMERVDGKTLRELLFTGPLQIKRLLSVAAQIAEGLARAHEAGIVHRDLKPENLMVTKDGLVKILDFGLAKLTQATSSSDEASHLQTESGTIPGAVLGTAGYMSPEQASGQKVDFRSDQFSFGSILYEMATGKRAFQRRTVVDTLSAILHEDPNPIGETNSEAPAPLQWIVERCFAKDPAQRYASTVDLARDLASVRDHLVDALASGARRVDPAIRRRARFFKVALGLALLVAGAIAALWLGQRAELAPGASIRFSVPPPPKAEFCWGYAWVTAAFSPDGSRLAFVADRPGPDIESSSRQIWLRNLAEIEARPLAGTDAAVSLFWSPDGRSIGFFTDSQLKRVDLSGGAPATICDLPGHGRRQGTWGDGVIVLAVGPASGGALYRVSPDGGTPVPLLQASFPRWPWFLPDGKRFLFVGARADKEQGSPPRGELVLASLDGKVRNLGPISSRVEYAEPGYIVFTQEGALFARRFDAKTERLEGPPIPLAPAIPNFYTTGWAAFAGSRSGNLAYASARDISRLAWFDRNGRAAGEIGSPNAGNTDSVAISPDGASALFNRTRLDLGTFDLWQIDLTRGIETRLTSDPGTKGSPIWLPDGQEIVYTYNGSQLVRRDLRGGAEHLVLRSSVPFAQGVTPDGRRLIFSRTDASATRGLWSLSLSGKTSPEPLFASKSTQEFARLSPDGKWLAFISDESGRAETYLAPLDASLERARLSAGGAVDLAWSRDGQKIFFVSPDHRLFAVSVRTSPSLQVGEAKPLFDLPAEGWTAFDVAPDGRFLAVVPRSSAAASPLTVVLNWTGKVRS